jgi:hypothetical protein
MWNVCKSWDVLFVIIIQSCFVTLKLEQIIGITTLKKHMNANHFIITNFFEEEVNSPLRGEVDNQPTKKIKSF